MERKNYHQVEVLWRWCAVCMSNQYHQVEAGKLVCTNPHHKYYLQKRSDSWVKKLPEWIAFQQTLREAALRFSFRSLGNPRSQ